MWHDSVLHRASYMFLKYYILFLSWRQGPLVWEEISSLPRFWFRGALKSFQINPANWKLCQFWRKPIPWVCKVWWKGVYMLNVSIYLLWNKNLHFSKVESPFNLEGYLIFYQCCSILSRRLHEKFVFQSSSSFAVWIFTNA